MLTTRLPVVLCSDSEKSFPKAVVRFGGLSVADKPMHCRKLGKHYKLLHTRAGFPLEANSVAQVVPLARLLFSATHAWCMRARKQIRPAGAALLTDGSRGSRAVRIKPLRANTSLDLRPFFLSGYILVSSLVLRSPWKSRFGQRKTR